MFLLSVLKTHLHILANRSRVPSARLNYREGRYTPVQNAVPFLGTFPLHPPPSRGSCWAKSIISAATKITRSIHAIRGSARRHANSAHGCVISHIFMGSTTVRTTYAGLCSFNLDRDES